jgi:RNA polymerase sigma factor (sigma-70 family)
MGVTRTGGSGLVRAAQAGDRAALDELVATYLPTVYTIVRQALDGHPDVDDVAQEVMLRAVRQLSSLRSPQSFRSWLVAIALHQVSAHQHRTSRDAGRVVPLDEAGEIPDSGAGFEGVTDLRVELSAQRRQVQRAGRWLDPDDRMLLSLWWLEVAGRLSRSELSAALGVTVLHAGVRVQRMRAQLELSRAIVAALEARPGCPRLADELSGWDGAPGPRWRKRLARHVRGCETCARAAGDRLPTERLLPGVLPLPVPATLTAALAKSTGGG